MSSQATKELNRLNFIRNFYREKFSRVRAAAIAMESITEESFIIYKDENGDPVDYQTEMANFAKLKQRLKRYDEVMAAIALIDEDLSRYV